MTTDDDELPLEIARCAEDQYGGIWVQVVKDEKACWISIPEFSKSDAYGFGKLRAIGVNALANDFKQRVKRQLQQVTPMEKILVATRPGYLFAKEHGQQVPVAFAYGSGELILSSAKSVREVIVGFDPIQNFGYGGKDETFQSEIGRLVKDQALPVMCICMALAPIIQPLTPDGLYVENAIVELCGATSTYKSAAAIGCGGSVWGGSDNPNSKGKLGFFTSANATINAIENSAEHYNNSLLGIDETTAFASQKKGRAEALGHFVHRLSLETPKARMNEAASLPFHTIALVTSNKSFVEICEESPEVLEALLTRLLTFQVPARSTLIFDQVPKGFPTASEAGIHFYTIGMNHFGHVARNMIAATLKRAQHDLPGLKEKIGKLMRSMMKEVDFEKLDSPGQRRFKVVALAYAAGLLAKKWGALDAKHFGAFKKPLLRAWRMTGPVSEESDPRARYLDYLKTHAERVHLVKAEKAELSDYNFDRVKAFVVKARDGQMLVAFPGKFMSKRFPGFERDFNAMKKAGTARCDEHLQTKLRVRTLHGETRQDRVYAIHIDSWPLN